MGVWKNWKTGRLEGKSMGELENWKAAKQTGVAGSLKMTSYWKKFIPGVWSKVLSVITPNELKYKNREKMNTY